MGEVDFAAPDIVWWELWVQGGPGRAERVAVLARGANLDVHADRLLFPDTTVVFVHATGGALAVFAERVPGAVTEIRRATGTIEPFLDRGTGGLGQHDRVAELAQRVTPAPHDAPVVCALDTGVVAEHPLVTERGTSVLTEVKLRASDPSDPSEAVREGSRVRWPPRAIGFRLIDREGREVFGRNRR